MKIEAPDSPDALSVLLAEAKRLRKRSERDQELVARVSHEFRAPVTAIKGFAETLRRGGLRDRRHRLEFVRSIEKHADWLGRIIEQVLALYSVESGRLPSQPERIALDAFVKGFAEGLAPVAKKRRVKLKASAAPGIVVWADRDHLERAVQSLCENAVGHAKSEVEIRGWIHRGRAIVNVRDDGPGIPAELLPRLFEGVCGPAPKHGRKGTGLGLRIAKCAIEAVGGRVWAENDPAGGASLRCALRLAR